MVIFVSMQVHPSGVASAGASAPARGQRVGRVQARVDAFAGDSFGPNPAQGSSPQTALVVTPGR